MKLITTILEKMSSISKPQSKFLIKALEAFLSMGGKLTFSNMARYINISEKTFARQFSKFFNFADFNRKMIETFYGNKSRKLAIAFDPFFMQKAGNKTYGKGKFWSGGSGRIEKGLEASLLCVVDLIKNTEYALSAKQTPNSEELKELYKNELPATRIDWFLSFIISMISMFPADIKYILVDCLFF
jgi:hypothetical protein